MTGDRVARAVNDVLAVAPRHGEVSLAGLVAAVGEHRERRIEVSVAVLPAGVSGQWRQYSDYDEFLIQDGLPTADSMAQIIDDFAAGKKPKPGSRVGRTSSEPEGGALTLTDPKLYDGSAAKKIKKLPNSDPVTA